MMNRTALKSLLTRLSTLRAELETCTTDAMRASVQGSIDAAEWELENVKRDADLTER